MILDSISNANSNSVASIDFVNMGFGMGTRSGKNILLENGITYSEIVLRTVLHNGKNIVDPGNYQVTPRQIREDDFKALRLYTSFTWTVEIIVDKEEAESLETYLFHGYLHLMAISSALSTMDGFMGTKWEKQTGSLRTDTIPEALAAMDCSEFVSRYLKEVLELEEVPSFTTPDLLNFRSPNDYLEYVQGSRLLGFRDIRPGDVFLWRDGTEGHTGVVVSYDRASDLVTVIESIGPRGSRDESRSENLVGYCKECVRTSVYQRTGPALAIREGWQGYFRPKTKYYKK